VLGGSALLCLLHAASCPRERVAWACIGAGLGSYAAGTLVYYAYVQRLDPTPYPSISDALWLSLYGLAFIGIGLLVKARLAGSTVSMWLDGLVCGLGLGSVSAAYVFPRVVHGDGGTAAVATNVAYPLLDLVLVITVVGAMSATGAWRERSWLLLGTGFLAFSGADSWYLLQLADGSYQAGSPVDATFQLAAVLVGVSATTRRPELVDDDRSQPLQTRSFLVPGFFALLAVAVLVFGDRRGTSALGVALAVGALLAAWGRTAIAVREMVHLADSRRQARTDALTGLPNRRAFYELLERAQAVDVDRPAAIDPGSVVLVDLDRFKEINDALGHQLGDRILRDASRRLAAQVPPGGTIARLGGDELALLLPGTTVDDAVRLVDQILESFTEPFTFEDMSVHLGASIGIAALRPGDESGRPLAEADLAMYRAKAARTGREIYDESRDGNAWDRLATIEELRRTLTTGHGLSVDLQPIVRLPHAQPVGLEALVRWNHRDRGRIPPDEFLPIAERAGLMPQLTRAVLRLSLDAVVELRRRGWTVPVSVNLTASDLLDPTLVDHIAEALIERGLPAGSLRIEITESLMVDRGPRSTGFLEDLRALGMDLAVDDFGTGYSCLAYLHDLPVSYLKIDRAFTERVLSDDKTAVIVSSTIDMAHRLGLLVVAEGVETEDQLQWLVSQGCDLVQGYHTGRPMAPERLFEWLARQVRVPLQQTTRQTSSND
jgi:diguanylate cyclase (GGDEF)-like protein